MLQDFIDTKAKFFVVLLFYVIGLGIMTIITLFGNNIIPSWYGIIVGIICMLAAIPMHILARRRSVFYLFSFLLNSIGSGFSVVAYYSAKNLPVDLFQMVVAIIPGLIIAFITYFWLQHVHAFKKTVLFISSILLLLLSIVSIVFWIKTGLILFSFGFYSILLTLFYIAVFGLTSS